MMMAWMQLNVGVFIDGRRGEEIKIFSGRHLYLYTDKYIRTCYCFVYICYDEKRESGTEGE